MRARILVAMFLSAAVVAAACGEWQPPTAPSSTRSKVQSPTVVRGATIEGILEGAAAASASAWSTTSAITGGITVTVVGTDISTDINRSGRFVLYDVPGGDIQLHFTGSGLDETLTLLGVEEGDDIRLVLSINDDGSLSLEAKTRTGRGNKAEVEGLIDNINPSTRTMNVADSPVRVPDGTPIRHGSTPVPFGDLHNGDRVHVNGQWDGNTVVAQELTLQNQQGPQNPQNPHAPQDPQTPQGPQTPTPTPGNDGPDTDNGDAEDEEYRDELRGNLQSLGGGCPGATFKVGGTTVTADSSTSFQNGPCEHLENGTFVEVAVLRRGTSARALTVKMQKLEFTGAVASMGGTCPALTLGVSGRTVQTFSWTSFVRRPCGSLATGATVEVKGTVHPNNVVKAVQVKHDPHDK